MLTAITHCINISTPVHDTAMRSWHTGVCRNIRFPGEGQQHWLACEAIQRQRCAMSWRVFWSAGEMCGIADGLRLHRIASPELMRKLKDTDIRNCPPRGVIAIGCEYYSRTTPAVRKTSTWTPQIGRSLELTGNSLLDLRQTVCVDPQIICLSKPSDIWTIKSLRIAQSKLEKSAWDQDSICISFSLLHHFAPSIVVIRGTIIHTSTA